MDETLKKLVHQYLDNTYEVNIETLKDYYMSLSCDNSRISITTMYDDVKELFNLTPYDCSTYFNDWFSTILIVDI